MWNKKSKYERENLNMKLTAKQALNLMMLMDKSLKRSDFKYTQSLGVDFGGYYDHIACRQTSGCTKMECIQTIILPLIEEKGYGISVESATEWLDERIPGWQEKIGTVDEV